MPIYQKTLSKGVRYFYKFDLGGKTYRSKAIYLTKQEAKKAEAEAYQQADYKQRHPTESQEIGLLLSMNERLDYVKTRKSEKYYNETRRYLSVLLNTFGDVSISTIKRKDIESLLQEESSRGAYTVNAMLRCYKALFNHVIDGHELDQRNPCVGIKAFAVDKRIKYIPSDEEIDTLLKNCDDNQRMLIEFIKDTGARINEALSLTGREVTKVDVTLYTRKSLNSNLVGRVLPKPDCLAGLTLKPDKRVFDMWTEQPKFLERKLRKLGLPKWGFHNLRHRYASILSAERVPIYEISKLLGHQSTSTTEIYLQLLPRRNDLGTNHRENKAM